MCIFFFSRYNSRVYLNGKMAPTITESPSNVAQLSSFKDASTAIPIVVTTLTNTPSIPDPVAFINSLTAVFLPSNAVLDSAGITSLDLATIQNHVVTQPIQIAPGTSQYQFCSAGTAVILLSFESTEDVSTLLDGSDIVRCKVNGMDGEVRLSSTSDDETAIVGVIKGVITPSQVSAQASCDCATSIMQDMTNMIGDILPSISDGDVGKLLSDLLVPSPSDQIDSKFFGSMLSTVTNTMTDLLGDVLENMTTSNLVGSLTETVASALQELSSDVPPPPPPSQTRPTLPTPPPPPSQTRPTLPPPPSRNTSTSRTRPTPPPTPPSRKTSTSRTRP